LLRTKRTPPSRAMPWKPMSSHTFVSGSTITGRPSRTATLSARKRTRLPPRKTSALCFARSSTRTLSGSRRERSMSACASRLTASYRGCAKRTTCSACATAGPWTSASEGGGERTEAPRRGRLARILEPRGVRGVVANALAEHGVVPKARPVLRVHEEVVRDVDGPTVARLVAGRRAPHHGDGRDPLLATEDVVERALERPELGVVDLDEERAVFAHERAGRLEALEDHRAPRARVERVVVLDEPPARVERRIEIDAPEPPGE